MKSRWISPGSAAAIVFVLTCGVFAQNPPPRAVVTSAARTHADGTISAERLQRIGQLIDRRIAAKDISGAVTLVAQGGHVVHFEARGLMDLESRKPMAKDSLFDIASMTKPVTTVAVLMLAEEGRLRLTDPVSRFIPAFTNFKLKSASGLPPFAAAARDITVRDLLTHTSGIVSEARIPQDRTETLASLSRPEYLPLLRERAKDQDSDVLESACIPTGLWIKLSVSLSDLLSASWPLSESGWCRRSIGEASERESGRQRRPLKRPQCSRSYLGSIEINKKAIVSGFGSLA